MNWDNLDSNDTFRLVFTDYQKPISYDYCTEIKKLINWRNSQKLPLPQLYVIKIGYSNFLQNNSLYKLIEFFFSNIDIFCGKPIRFSIYQDINDIKNFDFLTNYQLMAQALSFLNIHCTIGWIIDFAKLNDIKNFHHFLKENSSPNHVVVFHNTYLIKDYSILNNIYNLLNSTNHIKGYDLTSHINNYIQPSNVNYKHNLLEIGKYMKNNNVLFLNQVLPEISDLYEKKFNNNQTLKEQIAEFCQNGYIINTHNNNLSPLIYGSADDFSLPVHIPLKNLLLMVYEDVNQYFQTHLTKLFLKSYCSQCEFLNQCQQQKIYWLNFLDSEKCYIKINYYTELL